MSARRWSTLSLLALVSASCTSGSGDTADGARQRACDVSVQPRPQAETPVRASTALVATMRARFHRTGASPLGIPFASAPLSPGEAPIVFDDGRLQAPLDVARQTSPVDTKLVDTKLPGLADRPLAIRDRLTSIGLEASLLGAREVSAEIEDGLVVYRGALGEADLVRRVLADGVEDFVHLPTRPTDASIRWSISLSGPVKGLRLVGGIVEMLDERGTPRLRIGRPYLYGADGTRVDATSAIEGCSFDTSAAAPWGRPIVSPGSDHCTLRVSWLADSVRYPALVDPTFTATGSMATKRSRHFALTLSTGKVLITGGNDGSGLAPVTAPAELYDPASKTFAATGSLNVARQNHGATTLAIGTILVIGGDKCGCAPTALKTVESYSIITGLFTKMADTLYDDRFNPGLTEVSPGKLLITAGWFEFDKPELYSAVTGGVDTGAYAADPDHAGKLLRTNAAAVQVGAKVLVIAGTDGFKTYSTAEIYDIATNTFKLSSAASVARQNAVAVVPTAGPYAGKAVVAGGDISSEVYDVASDAWTKIKPLSVSRYVQRATATTLSTGDFLVVGGESVGTADLFSVGAGTWLGTSNMTIVRSGHAIAPLAAGAALVTGGNGTGASLSTAEIYSAASNGTACKGGGDCASGFCADGVCCDSACGACNACTSALKGAGSDGTCGPAKKATDPHASCTDDGSPKCTNDGLCDGAGACEKYAVASGCTPNSCASGAECTSGFCVDGICCDKACTGACVACTKALKGAGLDGVCENAPAGTNPRGICTKDLGFPANCKDDGLCNGSGACRTLAPKGTTCGAAVCAAGEAKGFLCDDVGKCVSSTALCTPYVCDASGKGCGAKCSIDTDCADTTFFCAAGACLAKKKNGDAASDPRECVSGLVGDAVCCSTACKGVCEACDRAGTVGTCSPTVGAPKHGTCPVGTTDSCATASCDGTDGTTCAAFAGPEVTCRKAVCASGVQIAEAHCESKGVCPPVVQKKCEPFKCDTKTPTCLTTCTKNDDCADGATCDTKSGTCVYVSTCGDEHTVVSPTGTRTDCAPARCLDGKCIEKCTGSADCLGGYSCDTASGLCQPAAAGSTQSSGGCTMNGRERSERLPIAALLLGLVVAFTRRRSISRARSSRSQRSARG